MAASVLAGLAQDRFVEARAFDARRLAGKRETVLYVSDFDEGFDNWIDHWDSFRPQPIASLTSHAARSGNRSLMISTGEDAYQVGRVDNTTSVFRRTTRPRQDQDTTDHMRYASFSAHLALGIGSYNASWTAFSLLIDTNKYDNTARNFFRLQCGIRPGPTFRRWSVAADSSTFITVPEAEGLWHGDNDNKNNFGYVRLTIDRNANGGLGGYHEAQIGPYTFDLTGLGGGSAPEPLQGVGDLIQEFNGGDNIGFYLGRSETLGGAQLYADDIVYSVSDQA